MSGAEHGRFLGMLPGLGGVEVRITIDLAPELKALVVALAQAMQRTGHPAAPVPASAPSAPAEPVPPAAPPQPAAPVPGDAVPVPPAQLLQHGHRGTVWTPARLAVMEREYPKDTPIPTIYQLVMALPGPPVSIGSIGTIASQHGIYRSKRTAADAAQASVSTPATYETIRQGAAERGLAPHAEPLDLDKINRKRVELGRKPFVRVPDNQGETV